MFCQTGARVGGSVRSQGRGENDKAIFCRRPEQRCCGFAQPLFFPAKLMFLQTFLQARIFCGTIERDQIERAPQRSALRA
jgi:hypothetical protein